MGRTVSALAAVLLTPGLMAAQVRPPDARPVPAGARVEAAIAERGCELATDDGLTLAFASCSPAGGAGAAREVEIIEYRNGDALIRSTQVTVAGVVQPDFVPQFIGLSDPADDAAAAAAVTETAARMRPGRMKVGRVTLRRIAAAGAGRAALPWDGGDVDGDGFPAAIELHDPSAGIMTVSFERCRAVSGTEPGANEVTLECRSVRAVAALDANPYARFIARATNRPDDAVTLLDRRLPPAAAASAPAARAPQSPRTFRLHGARLEGWSLDFDLANGGAGSWTLEVRVARIEMA